MADSLLDVLTRLRTCEWVDLTHAFGPGIPHYFAFPDEERETLFHFDEGVGSVGTGFLAHRYTHIGQWGTQVEGCCHADMDLLIAPVDPDILWPTATAVEAASWGMIKAQY